ncbi:hypothetical protein NKI20_11935 [Mesorhizobium sp. M0830]|uniref:hypothetical protein n=1 Tax=Mesorhizobium sp. M0830 TaxID=2957008 RepID=UPI00333B97B7
MRGYGMWCSAERSMSSPGTAAFVEAVDEVVEPGIVNGNDLEALRGAFTARVPAQAGARAPSSATRMCKGVPFVKRARLHFIRIEPNEWRLAMEALHAGRAL